MFELLSGQEITTKLFLNYFVGVGLSGFFVFMVFWLTNQNAMLNNRRN